jgi:hypothetical protein
LELLGIKGKQDIATKIAGKLGDVRTIKSGDQFVTEIFSPNEDGTVGWNPYKIAPRYKQEGVNLTVNTGDMTKATRTKIETQIMDTDAAIERLNATKAAYDVGKGKFQTYKVRWGSLWTAIKEKGAGLPGVPDASPAEKKQLSEYSTYKKTAVRDLNLLINILSGAAVSPDEAKRLFRGLPNPGVGLFDGDSPTEFEAAMGVSHKALQGIKIRLLHYKNQGYNYEQIKALAKKGHLRPLGEINAMINERGQQLEEQFREEGVPLEEIEGRVKATLKKEYDF